MSPAARAALINVGTNRQGATIPMDTTPFEAANELRIMGLIGPGGGLTRKGSGKRQLVMDDVMNEMFGQEN